MSVSENKNNLFANGNLKILKLLMAKINSFLSEVALVTVNILTKI